MKEINRVSELRRIRLARLDLIRYFRQPRIGAGNPRYFGVIPPDHHLKSWPPEIGWIANLDERFRLVLFKRVELRRVRAENARFHVVSAKRFLFHAVLVQPNLRTVILRAVANDHELEKRFVGAELHLVMELLGERAQRFKIGHADCLEIAGHFR